MNSVQALLERDALYDVALLKHGFTDYMRDYEIVVSGGRDFHRYQFIGCVEASCKTTVRPATFVESLSDDFVYSGPDYPGKDDPQGFIWGVRYSNACISYAEAGERAAHWSRVLGISMHEANIKSEAFLVTLVFADLRCEYMGDEPQVAVPKQYPIATDDRPT
jgi:hypothetical protein